jgi:cell division protein FtsB
MKARSLFWLATLLMALTAVGSVAVSLETLWGQAGWPNHRALAHEVDAILLENAQLSRTLDTLKREIAAQAERPEVQEALVRDLLGYVRPQDVIVRLEGEPPQP